MWVGAALMAATGIVWAQRPTVYPLRSQSAGAQSVDNAYCYWQARQQTHVDIVHESQRPVRTKAIGFAPDAGRGTSAPPLPADAGHAGPASAASAAAAASAAPASSSTAASPTAAASQTASVNAASGASTVKLPPLPPPEPPMTSYWHAFGECMQSRGYGVQ